MNKPLHVLVIEDSEADAILLLRQLRRAGYELTSQRVATEQELKAALVQANWDVVICDFALPGFGALPALKVLQGSGQDLPFIIVSGVVGEENAVAAMKAGADDFLLKNRLERLAPAVERELADAEARREHRRVEADRQRLIIELQEALAQLKTLSGLLPICAWCKKTRDDEGYWTEIETYISAHSQAEFSHSICPECQHRIISQLSAPAAGGSLGRTN
jgi:DNA-binding NtrC family response regulator